MDVRYRGIDGEFGAPATHCLRNAEEDIDSLTEDGRLSFAPSWEMIDDLLPQTDPACGRQCPHGGGQLRGYL
jgi:hypothetical protein